MPTFPKASIRASLAFVSLMTLSCNLGVRDERADVLISDFEDAAYGEWTATGEAFGKGPASGTLPNQMNVSGYRGKRFVNSFLEGDATTGTLTSPEFVLSRRYVCLLIGGGNHPGKTGAELVVGGKVVGTVTGSDSEELDWRSIDAQEFAGKRARIRIVDRVTGGWGHVNVDHILLSDKERDGRKPIDVVAYRESPEYYREKYRPQIHFTPEVNWMNDPNGLVYNDGEYHLFYQHNPFGNRWGHMSWGHAVSTDLVHWKHLPLALPEENGVMIFSGCCVVDHRNTSGFGKNGEPPLVAVYTGHSSEEQDQRIAYSTDRGRTWTKYAGNPVIDIDHKDFRDPKVFWHEPTSKWVMVVALDKDKMLQFYGSKDLKDWEHLSDFGPAGAKEKSNWECPDLFELPVEGEPGKSHWVLEVDMGGGSVAGGSGGEYFIGDFDGVRFVNKNPSEEPRWVDYGRDFYAPVSWSDIPREDGRRIWIGWLNNWETHLLPTHPWRSAQSIPRVLSLRTVDGELRLVQRPIRELEKLRGEVTRLENVPLEGESTALRDAGVRGNVVEIRMVLDVGDSDECGLRVLEGDGERTVVGCDSEKRVVFVDRSESGEDSFHKNFAGRHEAPVNPENGRIDLHVIIDTSVVELFANDGAAVITDRVFPDPSSQGMTLYSTGGRARVVSFESWPLSSIWR